MFWLSQKWLSHLLALTPLPVVSWPPVGLMGQNLIRKVSTEAWPFRSMKLFLKTIATSLLELFYLRALPAACFSANFRQKQKPLNIQRDDKGAGLHAAAASDLRNIVSLTRGEEAFGGWNN